MPATKTDRFLVQLSGRAANQEEAVLKWAQEHVIDAVVAPRGAVLYFEKNKATTDVRRLLARAIHMPPIATPDIVVTPLTQMQMAHAVTDLLATVATEDAARVHYICDYKVCELLAPEVVGTTRRRGYCMGDRITYNMAFDVYDVEPLAVYDPVKSGDKSGDKCGDDTLTILYSATLCMHEEYKRPVGNSVDSKWRVRMPECLGPLVTKVHIDGLPHGARACLLLNNQMRAVTNDDGDMSMALPYDTRCNDLTHCLEYASKAEGDAVIDGTAPYRNIAERHSVFQCMVHGGANSALIEERFPEFKPLNCVALETSRIDHVDLIFPAGVDGPFIVSYDILFATTRKRSSVELGLPGVEQGTIVTPFVLALHFWVDQSDEDGLDADTKTRRLLRATLSRAECEAMDERRRAVLAEHERTRKEVAARLNATWSASRDKYETVVSKEEREGFPHYYIDIGATFATMYSKPFSRKPPPTVLDGATGDHSDSSDNSDSDDLSSGGAASGGGGAASGGAAAGGASSGGAAAGGAASGGASSGGAASGVGAA